MEEQILEELDISDLVDNHYLAMNKRKERDLKLFDPRTSFEVAKDDFFEYNKDTTYVRVRNSFLPIGVHTVYRLLHDSTYNFEVVHLSFKMLIDMDGLVDLIREEDIPLIIQDKRAGHKDFLYEGKKVMAIQRGELGYRHMIFFPEGETTGFGVNRIHKLSLNSEARKLLDRLYRTSCFNLEFSDSGSGAMTLSMRQAMSEEMIPEQIQVQLLSQEAKRVQRRNLSHGILVTNSNQIRAFVRELINKKMVVLLID